MKLSVIIPVANDPIGLGTTLANLMPQLVKFEGAEVIVVIDGDYSEVRLVCHGYPVTVIQVERNQGSYNARNRGILSAHSETIGFLDAGVLPAPDWIVSASRAPQLGDYVGGAIVHPEPNRRNAVEVFQSLTCFSVENYMKKLGFAPTANLVVRREVFRVAGMFDARLRAGGDTEFGGRLDAFNFSRVYDSGRLVVHPYRSLSALVKKNLRVAVGRRILADLYPKRFGQMRPSPLFIARGLVPPSRVGVGPALPFRCSRRTKLQAYGVAYLLKIVRSLGALLPHKSPDDFEWAEGLK